MKGKKNILFGAIATIAVCLSIVVGATFALFQTTGETDVTITTAKINVAASAENVETYSYDEATGGVDKTAINGKFTNGGSAKIDSKTGSITLDKMSAGDKVTFDIVVENNSNIDVKYRTVVSTSTYAGGTNVTEGTAKLMLALNIKTQVEGEDEKSYSGWTCESDWAALDASTKTGAVKTVHVSIELPTSETDADLMDAKANIAYKVEAVQGNAPTENVPENEYRIYNEFDLRVLSEAVNAGDDFAGKTVKVMQSIYGSGVSIPAIGDTAHPFKGSFVSGTGYQVALSNLTFTRQYVYTKTYGAGIFGCLGDGAVVKNINYRSGVVGSTADVIDDAAGRYVLQTNIVGALSGYTTGKVTIENVSIGGVKVYGFGKVGGLIGMNMSGSKLTINNVSVWGTYIYGTYNVAGLIGYTNGAPTVINTKVNKNYTIDRITFVKDTNGYENDVDATLTIDGNVHTVKGDFYKYYESGAGTWLYAKSANLYIDNGVGKEYADKVLDDGTHLVADTAIVDGAGIVDGTLDAGAYTITNN